MFAVISLLSVVLVVWFGWGICDFTAIIPVGSDDISIVGSDWGVFLLTAGEINGMVMLIYFAAALIYALFAAAGAALSSVLLRVLALKNADSIGRRSLR